MTPATDLIGQVAFPVVACYMMFRLYREEREDRQQEREELRDEREAFRNVLDEHTEALKALARRVDDGEEVLPDGGRE